MSEWYDDTLVAILYMHHGRYKVLELPARQTTTVTSRRSFREYEVAEEYMVEQYPTALRVQVEDIAEEVRLRAAQAVQEQQEDA